MNDPENEKFLADALKGISSDQFTQAICTMCSTEEGRKMAVKIEEGVRKIQESSKNYVSLSDLAHGGKKK